MALISFIHVRVTKPDGTYKDIIFEEKDAVSKVDKGYQRLFSKCRVALDDTKKPYDRDKSYQLFCITPTNCFFKRKSPKLYCWLHRAKGIKVDFSDPNIKTKAVKSVINRQFSGKFKASLLKAFNTGCEVDIYIVDESVEQEALGDIRITDAENQKTHKVDANVLDSIASNQPALIAEVAKAEAEASCREKTISFKRE